MYLGDKFNSIEFQDVELVEFDENKLLKLVDSMVNLVIQTTEMKLERIEKKMRWNWKQWLEKTSKEVKRIK